MTRQHTKPCKGCPFARATNAGELGGSTPEVYIGQARGPFMLPCHNAPDYEKDRRAPDLPQCAGAAIYRANIGVAERMPDALLHLERDNVLVFENAAEFIAHHAHIPIYVAELMLKTFTEDEMLALALMHEGVRTLKMPKRR